MERLPPIVRESCDRYVAWLQERFGGRVRMVRLFGSYARGEAHEDSDVDVLAVVDDLTLDEWREALRAGDDVDSSLDYAVMLGPLVVSTEHWDLLVRRERLIAKDILAQGVPL